MKALLGALRKRLGRKSEASAPSLLDSLRERGPSPSPEREERARHLARMRHAPLPPLPGLSRRATAAVLGSRRRRPEELEEALRGLAPWQLEPLLAVLRRRPEADRTALARCAKELAERCASEDVLAGALALLSLHPQPEDVPLLVAVGPLPTLASFAAQALRGLPADVGRPALLELTRRSSGIGRAMVIEEAMADASDDEELAVELLRLAAEIDDPLDRVWGALPLLERVDWKGALGERPELGPALASALEASARGGWNGGPGPGLGRMPGAQRAAEALLLHPEAAEAAKRDAARAVLDSHPGAPLALRELAQETLDEPPPEA